MRMRMWRITLLAFSLLVAAPAAAQAADVSVTGNTLSFAALDGETNDLNVSLAGGFYTLVDLGGTPVTAGAGCVQVLPATATCAQGTINALILDGRDHADTITVVPGTAVATISGGAGDDVLTGGSGIDTLNGGADADRLDGGGGNDTVNGDSGDDTFLAGSGATGNDVFNGGTGIDLADYSSRSASLLLSIDGVANDGAPPEADNIKTDVENVTGGSGNDALLGGAPANVLVGGGGEDSLDGEAANDVLDGGADADVFTGGAGTDTVTYAARSTPVTVTLDGLAGDGEAGEDDTIRTEVETVIGGSDDDHISGSPLADTLSGGPGADTLHGEGAADMLNGDDGDDVLEGGAGGDTHNGGAGIDTADYGSRTASVTASLDGSANDGETVEVDNVKPDIERLLGGSGDDTLTGNNAVNVLEGGAGDDLLDPGKGEGDQLLGGSDIDTVTYSARTAPVTIDLDGVADDGELGENDLVDSDIENLTGGAANDRLTGAAGANMLSGGAGNDVLDGGLGGDMLLGGSGTDTADYSARSTPVTADPDGGADDGEAGENDSVETDVEGLAGGSSNDVLTGTLGTNLLSGGAGDDTIDGAQGDDDIDGGDGNDELRGGTGVDVVRGGAGNDRVWLRDGAVGRRALRPRRRHRDAGRDRRPRHGVRDHRRADHDRPDRPGGADGVPGSTGARPAPPARPAPTGRDAVVTCTPAKGKGKASKVTVTCSVKLAAAARASVRAVFKRGDRVVAAARGVRHSGGRISLNAAPRPDGPRALPARARPSRSTAAAPRSPSASASASRAFTHRVEAAMSSISALLRSTLSVFDSQ